MNRQTAKASFGQGNTIGLRRVSRNLFLVLVYILMTLPLFTTFNEALTKVVETTGAYDWLTKFVVPFETRAVSVLLRPFGIDARPTATHLFVRRPDGSFLGTFFSWNCLGWQSAVLLIFTLVIGLAGRKRIGQKVEVLVLGILGTFLINLMRISGVVVVAYYFGQLPTTLVHDYGGTLLTMLWLFFFWWFSYRFILVEDGGGACE